jgi:hypothetical protein
MVRGNALDVTPEQFESAWRRTEPRNRPAFSVTFRLEAT